MSCDFDVIIVGSGPAGVSSAFPLVEAGLRVLMVDAGQEMSLSPPVSPYLPGRAADNRQWEWMIGRNFHALRNIDAVSPKLRVPMHAPVFDGFHEANRIAANNFVTVGSLARGGLSNAWGCGVARLLPDELQAFPFEPATMEPSYARVTRRIGVSGAGDDDLADYFGLDAWSDPPISMDALQVRLMHRYARKRDAVSALGLRLGRSRVAVLERDRGDRQGCDLSGNCLWGCHRRAMYSATEDLAALRRNANFTYRGGFLVDRVFGAGNDRAVEGEDASGRHTLTAKKIVLAAGTLATTRLALQAIGHHGPLSLQACPTAAFLLWLPTALGTPRTAAFGLGQLSFALSIERAHAHHHAGRSEGTVSGFGSLFNPVGIPMAEFVRYMPLRKRTGIDFLKALLSSCVVGNIFLPGSLSTSSVALTTTGGLTVTGGYHGEVAGLMDFAQGRLRKVFRKLGAILLPGSFTVGLPGSDIHYASSLPMRAHPGPGETDCYGGLFGMDGIHIADGASLSSLSEKSHTLTIMANADRIGTRLALELLETSD